FSRKGVMTYDAEEYSEDDILEVALEAGAEDVSTQGGAIEVDTAPEEFDAVLSALEQRGFEHETAEITMVPETTIALDEEGTRKALRLVELLDDHDDVQSVSTNLDIPDDFEY
ncbi:MAG: YebC/PmpR family DNA-binding transcriptional regulator, partial [Spirochaetaceae bacterium]